MADKKYLKGSAKERVFGDGNSLLNISVNVDELASLPNVKGYVNITVSKRREVDKYGNTHSLMLNEYKPSDAPRKEVKLTPPPKAKFPSKDEDSGDLPF
jgi:hypothetical protein